MSSSDDDSDDSVPPTDRVMRTRRRVNYITAPNIRPLDDDPLEIQEYEDLDFYDRQSRLARNRVVRQTIEEANPYSEFNHTMIRDKINIMDDEVHREDFRRVLQAFDVMINDDRDEEIIINEYQANFIRGIYVIDGHDYADILNP